MDLSSSAAVNSLLSFSFPPPWHCICSPGGDVSWPSSDPCGLYNLAQQALISKSRLLTFTLLRSSHHWTTSSTPKGGNNPYPRRTEQSTAGVHRPHMHLVIRAPLFIHHLGQYSGSVLALHHLLAFVCVPCVCLYFSGPYKACLPWASSCVCVCVCYWHTEDVLLKTTIIFPGPTACWLAGGAHTLCVTNCTYLCVSWLKAKWKWEPSHM